MLPPPKKKKLQVFFVDSDNACQQILTDDFDENYFQYAKLCRIRSNLLLLRSFVTIIWQNSHLKEGCL